MLAILAGYMLLKPFYFAPSGLPQIGDAVLCLGAVFAMFVERTRLNGPAREILGSMFVFICYATAVNLFWALVLVELSIGVNAAFYIFNFILFFLCLKVFAADRELSFRWIAYTIAISAAVVTMLSIAFGNAASERQAVLFNNPNQLGYWALLAASIFFLCLTRVRIGLYLQVGTSLCLVFLAARSLSKAAILSLAFLMCIHFIRSPKLLVTFFIAGSVLLTVSSNVELVDQVTTRIEAIGEQTDDTIAGRGYDRILDHPQYLVLGAGEGGFSRFPGVRLELHSTFGTILFSYGVVGLGLFLVCLWKLLSLSGLRPFLYLLPAFLYGVTHQGLRFSFLWLLFAVVAAAGPNAIRKQTVSVFDTRRAAPPAAGIMAARGG